MIEHFFVTTPWWLMYLVTVGYFLLIYFGFALIAEWVIGNVLKGSGIVKKINEKVQTVYQRNMEIRRSIISIMIFGWFGVLPQQAYLHHCVNINWSVNPATLPLELIAIFLWNELHFYFCHRLLHIKWLFKHIHYAHHDSHIPTPWSAYSFHWFEATLLSTVMITAMFMYTFSYVAILFLPFISLVLNVLGHWDYDLFPRKNNDFLLRFSYRHSMHHKRVKGNYGFFLPWIDNLFHTNLKENKDNSKQVQN